MPPNRSSRPAPRANLFSVYSHPAKKSKPSRPQAQSSPEPEPQPTPQPEPEEPEKLTKAEAETRAQFYKWSETVLNTNTP